MFGKSMSKLRLIAIILSFIMFCIQFKTAIESLISPPEIDSSSIQSIEEVELPIITICPTNQINHTALKVLANLTWDKYAFYSGSSVCFWGVNPYSWGSRYNLTFEELKNTIYDVGIAKEVGYYNEGSNNSEVDLFFLPNHGYCKEIPKFFATTDLWIHHAYQDLQIFITDKNFKSYFSLDYSSQKGNPIVIEKYTSHSYHVEIEIDSSCSVRKESVKEKDNFQKCVDDEVHQHFGIPMGCVPPWMSLNNSCIEKYANTLTAAAYDLWKKYLYPTLSLRSIKIEENCRKYCSRARYMIQLKEKKTFSKTEALIVFNQQVTRHEKVFNYSMFQFIIDVGSSLGLWLGLSVLGIYEIATQVMQTVSAKKLFRK